MKYWLPYLQIIFNLYYHSSNFQQIQPYVWFCSGCPESFFHTTPCPWYVLYTMSLANFDIVMQVHIIPHKWKFHELQWSWLFLAVFEDKLIFTPRQHNVTKSALLLIAVERNCGYSETTCLLYWRQWKISIGLVVAKIFPTIFLTEGIQAAEILAEDCPITLFIFKPSLIYVLLL